MKIYLEPPSAAYFKQQILKEYVKQLQIAQNSAASDVNKKGRNYTEKLIRNSTFIQGLRGQELRGSFGIRPSEYRSRISRIVREIINDTFVYSVPIQLIGNKIKGGWVLAMGTDLFEKLKNTPAAITTSEKGVNLPWMRWTLEIGNAVIISDFRVKYQLGKGRSGFAHMIPNAIIGYRVPPQFAGTDHDNWITRTIIPYLNDYSDIILRTISRHAP